MMRPLLVLLVLVLVACADPVTAPSAGDPGAQHDAGPSSEPGDAGPGGAQGDAGRETEPEDGSEARAPDAPAGGDEPVEPAICPDPVTEAVGVTIAAQLDAFARGDYPAALAEASPGFQAATDVDAFQRLIERDYALLLDGARVEVAGCAQLRDDVSDVVAIIATADGTRTRFLYRLRFAEERWGIEAAVRLDPPPATA
jgi:hypothetical protein